LRAAILPGLRVGPGPVAVLPPKALSLRMGRRSILLLVWRHSLDDPLRTRTLSSGLESGRKVGKLNYRRIDFQDMVEPGKSKVVQRFQSGSGRIPLRQRSVQTSCRSNPAAAMAGSTLRA